MTIKDMIKKVDAYNEIVSLTGYGYHASLRFEFDDEYDEVVISNIKELKQYLNSEFFDWYISAILNYSGYEFNSVSEIEVVNNFGDVCISKVTVSIALKA